MKRTEIRRKTPLRSRASERERDGVAKPKRQRSERQRLKNKADKLCSYWIREAYDWTCAYCGRTHSRGSAGMHWSHLWSRRHLSVRWNPDNSVAHCSPCHRWLTDHPVEFAEWIRQYLGDGLTEILREKAHQPSRWTESELRELVAHIEADTQRIQGLREQGVTGLIKPEGFE